MTDEELDHTPLTFGQYKGQTPNEVSEHDPEYIVWLAQNFDKPVVSDLLARACKDDGK